MPAQIKYEVLTPTKVIFTATKHSEESLTKNGVTSLFTNYFQRNERKPKRNSSEFKSKKKLSLDDADSNDENSDSDKEQDVEDENFEVTTLETSMTRSGRQVKQRVIQGIRKRNIYTV